MKQAFQESNDLEIEKLTEMTGTNPGGRQGVQPQKPAMAARQYLPDCNPEEANGAGQPTHHLLAET